MNEEADAPSHSSLIIPHSSFSLSSCACACATWGGGFAFGVGGDGRGEGDGRGRRRARVALARAACLCALRLFRGDASSLVYALARHELVAQLHRLRDAIDV